MNDNNMNKSDISLAIALIIKYAKEQDIKQFLINCSERFDTPCKCVGSYFADAINRRTYKERFIFYICYLESNEKNILLNHLNALIQCMNSYFIISLSKINNSKSKSNKNISCTDIENILHEIIYCYKKYKFYYNFNIEKKILNKVVFSLNEKFIINDNNSKKYNLINRKRDSYIHEIDSGLDIYIHGQLKDIYNGEIYKYDSFLSTHNRIVAALTYNLETCFWCNPQKQESSNNNYKFKCNQCQRLLEELVSYSHHDSNYFNCLVKEFMIDDVENISQLRQKRKEILYGFLEKDLLNKQYSSEIKHLKSLIDSCFTTFIN